MSAVDIAAGQGSKPAKPYYCKFFAIKAGISVSSEMWYAPSPK